MSNVYNQTPARKRLQLGSFVLASPESVAGRGYDVEILATDATFGDPEPIESEIRSLLLDGARVTRLRDGNRESYFQVRIKAANPVALARAEADLRAQTNRINQLDWTPPHKLAPTSRFIVVTSSFRWLLDGERERQLVRVFGLRLVCLPHARATNSVTVDAVTVPGGVTTPTVTTRDNCSSAADELVEGTGWSAQWRVYGVGDPLQNIPITSDGTKLTATPPTAGIHSGIISRAQIRATRVWGTAFDSSPYMRIRMSTNRSFEQVNLWINGETNWRSPILVDGNDYYFDCPYTSVTQIRISTIYPEMAVPAALLYIDDVATYSRLPVFGTNRQLARTITVEGTERTPGSIKVAHSTTPIGPHVIVYTHDDVSGYTPPLVTGHVSGSRTTAATNVSGQSYNLDTPAVFEKQLPKVPTGRYELGALLSVPSGQENSSQDVKWTAQTYVGGVAVGEQLQGTTTVKWTGVTKIYARLARVLLPVTPVPSTEASATVRISIEDPTPSSGADISLDEAWIFNLTIGALTVVKTTKQRLWIDSADLPLGVPALWTGDADDQSDAYGLSRNTDVLALGTHIWNPGTTSVYTITQGVEDAAVSFEYTPTFTHHPLPLGTVIDTGAGG